MSGHSKWSTIKRKKGARDIEKGRIFTKMANLITIAVKEGGSDPEANFKLRLAIDEAKKVNVPAENIERAIKKGNKEIDSGSLKKVNYEGYGPNGSAFIVEVVTDNRKRTAPILRKIFSDFGGRLVPEGSVSWMFERKAWIGLLFSENKPFKADDLILKAIDCGALDVKEQNNELLVFVKKSELKKVKDCMEKAGLKINSAKNELVAKDLIRIDDEEAMGRVINLIKTLNECDDVVSVHSNLIINN